MATIQHFQDQDIPIILWWCNVPILKNDGVRQWVSDDIPIYEMENNPVMFQTTNQYSPMCPFFSGTKWRFQKSSQLSPSWNPNPLIHGAGGEKLGKFWRAIFHLGRR